MFINVHQCLSINITVNDKSTQRTRNKTPLPLSERSAASVLSVAVDRSFDPLLPVLTHDTCIDVIPDVDDKNNVLVTSFMYMLHFTTDNALCGYYNERR